MFRILSNTIKHIKRSSWIGIGSILVMTLSFFIISVFGGLAYVSNLYIKFFESRNNVIVFFDVGTDPAIVSRLENKWKQMPEIKEIQFTSEEDAYSIYSDYASRVLKDIYEVLIEQDEKKLPSSLDIQLKSLKDLDHVEEILQADVDAELRKLKVTPELDDTLVPVDTNTPNSGDVQGVNDVVAQENLINEDPLNALAETEQTMIETSADEDSIDIAVDSDSIDAQVTAFSWLRLSGMIVITILFIVVFFLTFMTVEFRLYNQMEEIGVMQLVGGSLAFIRAPYILEGGFYGMMGAFISSLVLFGLYSAIFIFEVSENLLTFLYDSFSSLPWPDLSYLGAFGIGLGFIFFGFITGALSSYLSIRRYIR